MAKKKTVRGGKRAGAGRKAVDDPLPLRSIRVDDARWKAWTRAARDAGVSLSAWIRRVLDAAAE